MLSLSSLRRQVAQQELRKAALLKVDLQSHHHKQDLRRQGQPKNLGLLRDLHQDIIMAEDTHIMDGEEWARLWLSRITITTLHISFTMMITEITLTMSIMGITVTTILLDLAMVH